MKRWLSIFAISRSVVFLAVISTLASRLSPASRLTPLKLMTQKRSSLSGHEERVVFIHTPPPYPEQSICLVALFFPRFPNFDPFEYRSLDEHRLLREKRCSARWRLMGDRRRFPL